MQRLLETAYTYYENREKLIYSYRGNTFLQGGELFDHENGMRGRIDCSTLVHLALQGIPYVESPYVTKDTERFFDMECGWNRSGTSGSMKHPTIRQVFRKYSDRSNDIRRAYGLAKYCREHGLELTDHDAELKPGDLVFFQAGDAFIEEYRKYGAWLSISHVGIVSEDAAMMINATGSSDHARNKKELPVKLSRISDRGGLVLAARIHYGI